MADFFGLSGHVALVTGAGQGIGAGIARRLALAGARIAVFDADVDRASHMADELGGIAIVGDVRSEADATAAVERVGADLGPLTILVNNAGITGRTDLSWNLTLDEMRLVMDVNVLGPFLFSKAAVPGMLAQIWTHPQRGVDRGQGRQPDLAPLLGLEGGRHRHDQVAGEGTGRQG